MKLLQIEYEVSLPMKRYHQETIKFVITPDEGESASDIINNCRRVVAAQYTPGKEVDTVMPKSKELVNLLYGTNGNTTKTQIVSK